MYWSNNPSIIFRPFGCVERLILLICLERTDSNLSPNLLVKLARIAIQSCILCCSIWRMSDSRRMRLDRTGWIAHPIDDPDRSSHGVWKSAAGPQWKCSTDGELPVYTPASSDVIDASPLPSLAMLNPVIGGSTSRCNSITG